MGKRLSPAAQLVRQAIMELVENDVISRSVFMTGASPLPPTPSLPSVPSPPYIPPSPSTPLTPTTPEPPCVEIPGDGITTRRGRPFSDKRHRGVVAAFHRLWGELRGGSYLVTPADGSSVRRLLKALPDMPVEEFERRMRIAFADPWFAQNGSLRLFCSRWSNYDKIVGKSSPPPASERLRRFLGRDPDTGLPVFAEAEA